MQLCLISWHNMILQCIPSPSEKYVGGALFLSLYPASACKELLKKLDLTPEGETILLKTVKEVV